MKNNILLLLVLVLSIQVSLAADYKYGFLVEFTDKENSVYSIDRPLEFLSERAIERRIKYGIDIIEQDLPVNATYVDSLVSIGGILHVSSKWMNSAVFYTDDLAFEDSATYFSFVSKVTKVYGSSSLKSNNKLNKYGALKSAASKNEYNYGASENQITMCRVDALHNMGYQGEGLHIAVLDAGFINADVLECFDSLRINNRILGGYDFVSSDTFVYTGSSHGTQVLSTIAANSLGEIYGSAPRASYWLLRTEDANSEYRIEEENWIAGAEFADSAGVDLLTTSLGYSTFDDAATSYSYEDLDGKTTRITQGSEIAFSKGMVVVNSAGNSGLAKITAPADGANVLTVGAVNSEGVVASFSSRGPSYDGRVKPDVCGQGEGTAVMGPNGTVYMGNGTSYSCPLIAGMVTCLWQANPTLSNQQIIDVIRQSGDIYKSPDDETGYGIPDFSFANFLAGEYLNIDSSEENLIQVYPNPFVTKIGFDFIAQDDDRILIEIFDLSGNLVYSKYKNVEMPAMNRIYIDGLGFLSSGVYFLILNSDSSVYRSKLVKE